MGIKVGINGFGRIGRAIFRASKMYEEFSDIEIIHINDLTNTEQSAYLLKYDSVFGKAPFDVRLEKDRLIIDGQEVRISNAKSPSEVPWAESGVDFVIEATGRFRDAELARGHLEGGARKVIITAPAKGDDITIVMGVNEDQYDPSKHHIVSNASCTTNCLAPVAKVILDRFGIVSGFITTVHAYTNDQRLLDLPHNDLRRARAAAINMIPTKTGAASAIGKVIPELTGKLDGLSIRVPTPNVSLTDMVLLTEKTTTVPEVNEVLKQAQNRYLGYTEEPLVSSDFYMDPRSSIVDGLSTKVTGENLVKILAWYDNEWGYSNRVLDLILHMSQFEII